MFKLFRSKNTCSTRFYNALHGQYYLTAKKADTAAQGIWALSLAHQQLSLVFFQKTITMGDLANLFAVCCWNMGGSHVGNGVFRWMNEIGFD